MVDRIRRGTVNALDVSIPVFFLRRGIAFNQFGSFGEIVNWQVFRFLQFNNFLELGYSFQFQIAAKDILRNRLSERHFVFLVLHEESASQPEHLSNFIFEIEDSLILIQRDGIGDSFPTDHELRFGLEMVLIVLHILFFDQLDHRAVIPY